MAGQRFYAHTLEGDLNTDHWQELEAHLSGVASRAAKFAAAFASRDWGFLAGLWHDLGHCQVASRPTFQDKKLVIGKPHLR